MSQVDLYRDRDQSKLLRHFTAFLPSQCWCERFGELKTISNIGRTRRRRARGKKKKVLGGSVPTTLPKANYEYKQSRYQKYRHGYVVREHMS